MLRSILAVVIGYLIFAVSAVLLFSLSGQDSHDVVPMWFLLISIAYGASFAALGGYLAATIARHNKFRHAAILSIVIGTGALISLLSRPGKGAIWSQLSALLVMAPAAMIGGYLRNRKSEKIIGEPLTRRAF